MPNNFGEFMVAMRELCLSRPKNDRYFNLKVEYTEYSSGNAEMEWHLYHYPKGACTLVSDSAPTLAGLWAKVVGQYDTEMVGNPSLLAV